ncbi:hypothetical protein I4641_20575 [Waterburya agarophytonicola K14]|uniref:Uncharacterized protein n=1 Tax=Waterburya agarophytonicola KI4 TaxID=2874699 RepID=A0A964BY94_9CYAN|nr:hypothetical protein [Waterburya agarophytonicola]MCC0179360.1 hypothetical protein [Waterburya agarophytonicola KI4]
MKMLKLFKNLGIALLFISTIFISIIWNHSSDITRATTFNAVNPNTVSVIDTINNRPARLRTNPQLRAALVDSIIPMARDKVQRTENIEVTIPIPSRGSAGEGVNLESGTRPGRYEVIANRNTSGEAEPITPTSLDGMFAEEERNNGTLSRNYKVFPQANNFLVADARGLFVQEQHVNAFQLIALDRDNNNKVVLINTHANDFCIDALNAVNNNTWKKNYYDIDNYDIDNLNN